MSYNRPKAPRKIKGRGFAIITDPDGGGTIPPPDTDPDPDPEPEPTTIIEPSPPPEEPESRSVLGEILEAFTEISYAFNGMGLAFTKFGNVIETEADNLGIQMKTSVDNIKGNIDNVVSKFGDMGKNLADNFETT